MAPGSVRARTCALALRLSPPALATLSPLAALSLGVPAARAEAQAPITVSGRVTSDNGAPLADVSIELRALALGALPNADGR